MGLRPSMLDDLGLGPALQWQAREFTSRSGTQVKLDLEGDLSELPEEHRTCFYRIVQEALTNCARHSQATRIHIRLNGDQERISLTLDDDGSGFDRKKQTKPSLGLIGMEERARDLGGTLTLRSTPGKGTTV